MTVGIILYYNIPISVCRIKIWIQRELFKSSVNVTYVETWKSTNRITIFIGYVSGRRRIRYVYYYIANFFVTLRRYFYKIHVSHVHGRAWWRLLIEFYLYFGTRGVTEQGHSTSHYYNIIYLEYNTSQKFSFNLFGRKLSKKHIG